MFKVLEAPLEEDLSQFSRLLWQQKISHRIIRLDHSQVLTVTGQQEAMTAVTLYSQWQRGEVLPDKNDSSDVAAYFNIRDVAIKLASAFRRAPLSLFLILLCIVLAVLAPLESMNGLTRSLLYPDFSYGTSIIDLERVMNDLQLMVFLKMLSPAILHGGLVHLSFNMLWLWEFGRRIEAVQASWVLLLLIIILALVSNTAQYLYGGSIYFGGMSGVVYGLFGYIWMWQLFDPAKGLALPCALVFFLLLSLVIITALDLDFIADEAHIGGFLAGILYGATVATVSKVWRSRNAIR